MNERRSMSELIADLSAQLDVRRDDLPRLAKMHGRCEEIVAATRAGEPKANEALHAAAAATIQGLERLILGESADPDETLATCIRTIQGMADAAPGPVASAAAFESPESPELQESPEFAAPTLAVHTATGTAEPATAAVEPFVPEPLRLAPGELEFVQGFVVEAGEHLGAVETTLLEVERAPRDLDKINELFRPVHTIKGMAGFLNLRDIQGLAHEAETLLDQARKGTRHLTSGSIDLVFQTVDLLKKQVAAVGAWVEQPHENVIPMPPVAGTIQALRDALSGVASEPVAAAVDVSDASSLPEPEAGASAKGSNLADQYVRIDTAKLDGLVDMVGELVIAQTQVSVSTATADQEQIQRTVAQATKIVRDLQEVAMALRMTPIGPTFQRMGRLVRDVSRKLGKQVELVLTGEDTELDKTVIQSIGDPLVHMVRNSMDHGIEMPEGRRAAGKSETGRIELSACHRDGTVQIVIRDDGRGLDREKLIAKALEKGLVQPGQALTDAEAFALIFAPGFSTATTITDVSGRGVGMDVVRRNVEKLRGKVEIASELGKGTTFTIRLPLTLAIIDGMVVRVGGVRFIIPTISIRQALRLSPAQISTVQNRGRMCDFRGRLVPLVPLTRLYRFSDADEPSQAMTIIAEYDDRQIGLIVDELIGQQQVVIKSLDGMFQGVRGVSGAAILGDGRVGLILDVGGVAAAFDAWRPVGEAARGHAPATLVAAA